jgi:hypothetical protein
MASAIIHLAVANEINKVLNKDYKAFMIGSIAPDIWKQVGQPSKIPSHFKDYEEAEAPNLDKFLDKYEVFLDDDFVLGYYIHLITDYYWFKYFIPNLYNKEKSIMKKLDGTKLYLTDDEAGDLIYNDYTNLNVEVVDKYNLKLDLFYEEVPKFKRIITEIPMDKLNVLMDKMGIIIENSTYDKEYIFDIEYIDNFVEVCVSGILDNLKKLNLI